MDIKNIENIYPLSHLQQAILLNDLYSSEPGFYCGQVSFKWLGKLDLGTLENSWQRLVECYPVLRTIFLWENLDQPQQIVQKQLKISLEQQDWLSLSSTQQEKQLEDFLNSDRDRGFEPVQPPLVRLTVCQLSENSHQLVFSYHPLVLDEWSANLILEQIFECYDCFCQGQQWQPRANPPYRDYMAWLKSKDTAKTEQFWGEILQGFTTPTQIPVKQIINGEGEQSDQYGEQSLQLSPELSKQVQSLINEQNLNLNTLVQGAWALLLSRYTGQDDVVFGQTTSIRPPELENSELMVGPLTNTLPMGVHIVSDTPLLNWLKQLENQEINLQQYGYSSLMKIQELNHLPLFESQVVLNQNAAGNFGSKYRETKQISDIKRLEAINFPITVTANLNPELMLQITYNRRQFDGDVITRMLDHMKTLLEGMVEQLEQPLSKLTILSEAEREQLLVEWNQTKTDYPEDKCIHQLFEEQVQLRPDNVAVVLEEQQLTYQQLNERANQLGNYLSKLGVRPEVPVAISLDRSLEMIVGLLGILKAGGTYVPLDPTYPFERLSFLLDDVQPPVLLTKESLLDELPSHWAQVVCLDSDWEEIAQESQENPSSGVTPKNLAYIIHTSGSTGTPKGVMLEHLGLCNLAKAQIKLFDVKATSRVLQFASLSFDASIWEIVMALSAGARLCLGTWDSLFPGSPLLLFLQNHAITHSTLPPSALSALPWEDLPALQTIIVAGEACSPELIERWSSGRRFFNAYGPTEATVCATVARCSDGGSKPPIGRPINNTQVYILDHHLQPVPVGVPGELHIGGVGLARGYLNRSDLTEKKFIINPFSDQPESRLYKTGDLARYLPDGKIEFMGRIDSQVKIRGFRIELGEIEYYLTQHPMVKETVVVVTEESFNDKRLVAYLVLHDSQTVDISDLRRFLKARSPEYMIPSAFVILDSLPLTPNGKVDRKALPDPSMGLEGVNSDFVAPSTVIEKTLIDIWQQVLKRNSIGINDNFFELGGDSILSIQIIARANQAGFKLTTKQLFEYQTVAELARVAESVTHSFENQELVTGSVALTPIQSMFLGQTLPEPNHFNMSLLLEVSPELKAEQVEKIVIKWLEHHDALRMRFSVREEGWQQVNQTIGEAGTVPFSSVDLSGFESQQQQLKIEQTAEQMQKSLDLLQGQLLRVVLFDLGAQQPKRLLLIIHHLVVDGVSWRILLEDLSAGYQQLEQEQPIQLPKKTTSFQKWAKRLQDYSQSPQLSADLEYWFAQLRAKMSPLPVDFPTDKSSLTITSVAELEVALNEEQTQALVEKVPSAYKTQINDVLLTALIQSLAQWTGEKTALIDLEGHGREELFEDVDLSRTVGWFTTVFPVLLKLESDEPGEGLKSIKEQLRQIPQGGISYGIGKYLSSHQEIQAKMSGLPQADLCFNYLGQLDTTMSNFPLLGKAQESMGKLRSPLTPCLYLLEINAIIIRGRLQIRWSYSEKVYRRSTIEGLAEAFIQALLILIDHCQSPEAEGYTASDFPLANLDQQAFQELSQLLD